MIKVESSLSKGGKKKVAIIGTNGIPACYGGFETLAENLTTNLSSSFEFHVYCARGLYSKKPARHHDGSILHYLPLSGNGKSSIFYDFFSMLHAIRYADVLLVLGVSGCLFLPLLRVFTRVRIIVNVDGIESRREKWNQLASSFLRISEASALKFAHIVIADNVAIRDYLSETYRRSSEYIAYGGDHVNASPIEPLSESWRLRLNDGNYGFTVCRIEPENNIRMLIKAFSKQSNYKLLIVGNWKDSEYGKEIKREFTGCNSIILQDPIYDQRSLNQLRANCSMYIHGHSAGGTNPSLVEAMCLGLPIFAFDVVFNRATTAQSARYFRDDVELLTQVSSIGQSDLTDIGTKMKFIASERYTWRSICRAYKGLLSR